MMAVTVLAIAVEVAVSAAWSLGPWRSAPRKLEGDATWAAGARAAPDFRLFDQGGRAVTLRSERGRTVVLAFLYSHCRELCPTIGAELTQVQRALPPDAQPQLVVISTDPGGDTPASVRAFAANEGWNGRWQWLLGTRAELAPVWRAYGIEVKPSRGNIAHSGAVYLIDRHGDERSGYVAPFLVQDILSDLRTLSDSGSKARIFAVAAAGFVGLAAIAVLTLLMPWAVGARAWVARLGRRRRIWTAVAAVVFVGAAAAFLLRPADSAPRVAGALIPTSARRSAVSLTGAAVLIPPRIALSAERGRIVYINFWASWCIPCRQEAPAIRAFARGLDPRHALFVGVNVSDKRTDAMAFIRRYGLKYPIIVDTSQTISRRYDVLGLPTTVAIDRRGRVAVQLLGPQTIAELRATLARLTGHRR
jgi:cytochrome oxidase Cu insertion factor (SCO1/SenC/PrrC family)/thiol-disulfide isomerase/thioredoxin